VADFSVPAGATVATGVIMRAREAGSASSGVGAVGTPVDPVDSLQFVASVVMEAASQGGLDAESDDEYLGKVVSRIKLMGIHPVLEDDFRALAEDHPVVDRALALDGYNPADNTYNNERMVAIVPIDANGAALSAGNKTDLQNYILAHREVSFLAPIFDPTYTTVDVTFTIKVRTGYDLADTKVRVINALQDYLSAVNWGLPEQGDKRLWINKTEVLLYDLGQIIRDTEGVASMADDGLTIGLNGGAQTAADHTLAGVAPLPIPGAIDGTTTY
jgi:hypothetical protein